VTELVQQRPYRQVGEAHFGFPSLHGHVNLLIQFFKNGDLKKYRTKDVFLEITWLKSRSRKNASETISSFAFRTPKRGTLEIITTDLKVQFSKARYLFLLLLDSLATNISSFDFELFGLDLTVE